MSIPAKNEQREFKLRPFKPRPMLTLLLALTTLGWLGFLVVLYFKTVRGHSL